MPRVSVVIPTLNRRKLLPEALDCLLRQTFQDWEAIVVDDGSDDDTFEVERAYAKRDSRFRCMIRQGERSGANVCRNQGIRASTSPFLVFLDSDDLLLPDALGGRVQLAEGAPDADFCVFMTRLFARNPGDSAIVWNEFSEKSDLRRFLRMDLVWHTSGPIWRRDALLRVGGFDESLASFQDWDIHVRALIAGLRYRKVPKVDHLYRRPDWQTDQLSSKSTSELRHLKSHRGMFRRTVDTLAGAADPSVRALRAEMRPLYWWLAELWRQTGDTAGALDVWREARALGLCSRFHHRLGSNLLRLHGSRLGRHLLVLSEKLFPSTYDGLGSRTFHPIAKDVRSEAGASCMILMLWFGESVAQTFLPLG